MTEKQNKVHKQKKGRKAPRPSGNFQVGRTLKRILGGELLGAGTFRFFPFLVFIAFLAFVYIANNYYSEAKIRKINSLRKELKAINFEYITTKSKLEDLTKQSKLSKQLEGTGLVESTEPVKTIKMESAVGSND